MNSEELSEKAADAIRERKPLTDAEIEAWARKLSDASLSLGEEK